MMRKHLSKFLVSILAFAFGIGAVLFWFSYNSKEYTKVDPPVVLKDECLEARNFPGISKEISKIEKGNSGYFPIKTFFEEGNNGNVKGEPRDIFADKWFGEFLTASEEKTLLDISDKYTEVYRFTLLESFGKPIIVSAERKADRIELVFKELDGQGGYEPGKIINKRNIKISEEEWCEFIRLLNESDYWQMQTLNGKNGLDGASWLLEGVKDGRYHIVYRWSPEKTKFSRSCLYLLKLSGFDLDKYGYEL